MGIAGWPLDLETWKTWNLPNFLISLFETFFFIQALKVTLKTAIGFVLTKKLKFTDRKILQR